MKLMFAICLFTQKYGNGLRLHVWLKHEMAGTKKNFLIRLHGTLNFKCISSFLTHLDRFWTSFNPIYCRLKYQCLNKGQKLEIVKSQIWIFWVAGFYSNFYQIITIMYENCGRKKNWGLLLKLGILEILLFFGAKSIHLGT